MRSEDQINSNPGRPSPGHPVKASGGGPKFILLLQKQNQFLRKQNQFLQKQSTRNDSASRSKPECIPLRSKNAGCKINLFRNHNQFPTGFQKQNKVFRKQNGNYSGIKISYSGSRINPESKSQKQTGIKIHIRSGRAVLSRESILEARKYSGSKMDVFRHQNKLFRKQNGCIPEANWIASGSKVD